MAENELQQSIGDSYKCPICLETCQELKTLNCQHSFCLSCLQKWMTKKGTLECPNCRQMHPIPEGGLQELPSNAIEVETAEHLDKDHDNISCCCGKCNADFYCEDCSKYLCTTCKNSHDLFPALKNHKLESINTNWPRSLVGPELLHQPMCPLHEKGLEFYCNICKTPICRKCAVTDHKEDEGQHELIRTFDAFKDFKTTATDLLFAVTNYERKIKLIKDKCLANASKLEHSKNSLKKEINDALQEIVNLVKDTGIILDKKLDDVYKTKKETTDSQFEELNNIVLDVKAKENVITKLLACDEATALLTCQQAISELQEKIAVLPDAEPRDDGMVYFSGKDLILSTLKKHGIGIISEKNESMFEIVSDPITVACNQTFHVKITQRFKCEIDIKDLTVSEFEESNFSTYFGLSTGPTYQVVKKSNGDYFVEGSSHRALKLDIKYCNSSIKGSPIAINVESKYPVIRIENVGQSTGILSNKTIKDLLMFENGWFLVACDTNEIFKFDNSGAFISKITLPLTSAVHRICKLKNNNLVFFDLVNRNITICKQDGQLIKSISTVDKDQPAEVEVGVPHQVASAMPINTRSRPRPSIDRPPSRAVFRAPVQFQVECSSDIDVNEALNLVYVADHTANCVQVFNMESNLKVKTIGSKGGLEGQMNEPSGVAITKEGNLIVADTQNHRLQLFGTDGQFIKVLIGGGGDDGMVIKPIRVDVDNDDNMIVVSESKVQLFNKYGKFIRTINRSKEGECKFFAISIVSHFPRRLALAEECSNTVNVINY